MAGDHRRICTILGIVAAALLLSGCGSTSSTGGGAGKQAAAPQIGLYKVGTPYQVSGVWYYPAEDFSYDQTGIASWYGPGFHGRRTANGERYDQHDLTAAHPTLPMPSLVRVTNLENGRSLKLRINDRGPFSNNRIIDVSQRAAKLLGFEKQGTARVRVQVMDEESRQLAAIARGDAAPAPREPRPEVAVAAVPVDQVEREEIAAPQPAATRERDVPASALPDGVVTQEAARSTALFVQAGAFTEYGNASRLAEQLQPHGTVQIEPAAISGRNFYRVRIGPVESVDQADGLLARLISNGYTDSRVIVQ